MGVQSRDVEEELVCNTLRQISVSDFAERLNGGMVIVFVDSDIVVSLKMVARKRRGVN